MLRALVCLTTLIPAAGWSCNLPEGDDCKRRVVALVTQRAEAIRIAFGRLESLLPSDIEVRFMSPRSHERARFADEVGYDRDSRTLFLASRLAGGRMPRRSDLALHYWAFYTNKQLREEYPLVRLIDRALWNAYLQEAAGRRGLTWPHADCRSPDAGQRLPCEMLRDAIAEHVTRERERIFNTNGSIYCGRRTTHLFVNGYGGATTRTFSA